MRTITLVFMILLFGCREQTKENSNIEITSHVFNILIKKFHKVHSEPYNKIVSVSIWITENDTTIGLYANKKLKAEYYIGYKENSTEEIYLYSNYKGSIPGLYKVESHIKKGVSSEWDYEETYSEFYYYNNGIFKLQKTALGDL